MSLRTTRRRFLAIVASSLAWLLSPVMGQTDGPDNPPKNNKGDRKRRGDGEYVLPAELSEFASLSLVLGRITEKSVTVSALAAAPMEIYFEYGNASGSYTHKTKAQTLAVGEPSEVIFNDLTVNSEYFYRVRYRKAGQADFAPRAECRFHTHRPPGSTFTFAIQGDSHPERPQMSDPLLYARTLQHASQGKNDFYICMGDDFSVDTVRNISAQSVAERYTLQRPFLGLVAQSAPLFLLNGNHEQASLFNFNQADVRHDVAVFAQNARNKYFPTPAVDRFYSGDTQELKSIGPLKDYLAWSWGDALFVLLDNYWQSPALVDNGFQEKPGNGKNGNKDWWGLTLGDAQYKWLKKTLEESSAKYKFVFAHHVLGSGRGGIDQADLYEWGGKNKRGDWEFPQKRPGWDLPVHQVMAKHNVTVFFQGHDHLYARQERDGIVYQEVPMPADAGYETYNADRYNSGIKLPNAGYLRVTVAPEQVKVEYVRCYLPKDENDQHKNGEIAHSYTINGNGAHA